MVIVATEGMQISHNGYPDSHVAGESWIAKRVVEELQTARIGGGHMPEAARL